MKPFNLEAALAGAPVVLRDDIESGHTIIGMCEELQPCPKCGDTEHQMTATNDNTSVFCQECGHHYIINI